MMLLYRSKCGAFTVFFLALLTAPGSAEDSEVSRATLKGMQAVRIIVEQFQPNLQKYTDRLGPTAAQIHRSVEQKVREGGIRIVEGDEWLKVPGRPVLYVSINTHDTERYSYAYDIKVELRQVVLLAAYPHIKSLANTWSINITGVTNIGNLEIIKHDVGFLVDRFILVYTTVNKQMHDSSSKKRGQQNDETARTVNRPVLR